MRKNFEVDYSVMVDCKGHGTKHVHFNNEADAMEYALRVCRLTKADVTVATQGYRISECGNGFIYKNKHGFDVVSFYHVREERSVRCFSRWNDDTKTSSNYYVRK